MKLPDFLQGTELRQGDMLRLQDHMANWMTAHAYIRTLEPNERGLKELRLMLLHEIQSGRRLHMLQRLRARFNSLRIKHEDKQIFTIAQYHRRGG